MTKSLLIALLTPLLLGACTGTHDAQPSMSYAEPAPGTVTVHMNGSLGTALGYTSTR